VIFGDRVTPRYILRDFPAREQVEEFADANEWPLVSEAPGDPERYVSKHTIWLTPTTITLDYEEEYVSQHAYAYYRGRDLEAIPELVGKLEDALHPWTREELLSAVSNSRTGPERARAVMRAALGAPLEFDQEFFEAVKSCMEAHDAPLRNAAAFAAGSASWPQFRPLLERIASQDPEMEVREMAQGVLRAYNKFRIGGQS
jgi:hypothetical protein